MPTTLMRLSTLFLCVCLAVACQPVTPTPVSITTAQYPAEMATRWFKLELRLIEQTPGFSPPVASRALGYTGVTLYEAVVGGMPEANSLVGQLNGLEELPQPEARQSYHWPAVANSALAAMLRNLYPAATLENLAAIDTLEQQYAAQYKLAVTEAEFNRSVAYGQALAAAIFEWSKTDGGHEGYATNFPKTYTAPIGPGLWVPTPPNHQTALQPTWGQNRPFVLQVSETCATPPPPSYSEDPSSQFYAEGKEVYDTVQNLTPEQREIALFWADNAGVSATPPGHSISILTQVLLAEEASLALAAEAYAKVGMAVADAFIGCWRAKYIYNVLRPISYIQVVIDPTWNTPNVTDPILTPPFPEYPSGHSTQSAAVAVVLTDLFGEDYAFTDETHALHGLPARSFSSFAAAANEAAFSRLYGGIHYRAAIEQGLAQGECIGNQVNTLYWDKAP